MKKTKTLNLNKFLLIRVNPMTILFLALITIGIIFAAKKFLNPISPEIAVVTDGSSDPCSYSFSIPRPSPSPSPSSSPSPSPKTSPSPTVSKACRVSFELPDTAVCWRDRRVVDIKYTVHDLPDVGGPFYMQTDWYVAAPVPGPHHYDETQLIEEGKSYIIRHTWPGIPTGERRTVETHAGLNVVDKNRNLLSPNCSAGMDYYWTPYVVCP